MNVENLFEILMLLGAALLAGGFLVTILGPLGLLGALLETATTGARLFSRRQVPDNVRGYPIFFPGPGQVFIPRPELPGWPPWRCRVSLRPAVFGLRSSLLAPETAPFERCFAFEGDAKASALLERNRNRIRPMLSFLRRFRHALTRLDCTEDSLTFAFVQGTFSPIVKTALEEMLAFADAFYSTFLLPPLVDNPPPLAPAEFHVEGHANLPRGPHTAGILATWVRTSRLSPAAIVVGPTGERRPLALHPELAPLFDWNFAASTRPLPPKPEPTGSSALAWLWLARRPFIPAGISLLLAGIGLLGFGMASRDHLRDVETRSWPTVSGTIVESQVRTECSNDGKDCWKVANIRYRFRLGATEFDGTNLGYLVTDNAISPDLLVRRYPQGKELLVHYRPEQPQDAVLEPGAPSWSKRQRSAFPWAFGLGLGLFVPIAGLGIVYRLGRLSPPVLV